MRLVSLISFAAAVAVVCASAPSSHAREVSAQPGLVIRPRRPPRPQLNIKFTETSVSDAALRGRYACLFKDVACQVGSRLSMPPVVEAHLGETAIIGAPPAFASAEVHAEPTRDGIGIRLGRIIEFSGKKSTPAGAEAAGVHELGHALFESTLLASSPRYRALTRERPAAERRKDEQFARLTGLSGDLGAAENDPDQRARVDERLARETSKYLRLNKEFVHLNVLASSTIPHHELFADSVAVLYYRDGKTMSRTLSSLGLDATLRDFSVRHSQRATEQTIRSRAHDLAAPVRSLVWQTYCGRRGEAEDPRPAMLESLARASAELIDAGIANGHPLTSVRGVARELRRKLLADPSFIGRTTVSKEALQCRGPYL